MVMGDGLRAFDYSAPTYFTGVPAYLLASFVLVGGAFLIGSLFRLRGELVARAAREQNLATEGPLVEGRTLTLRGKVALADEDPSAPVRVQVRQKAKNHTSKNNKWHTWEEVSPRAVMARPFLLEREGGETVKVEPGHDVFLIDDITTIPDPTYATKRSRVSEVVVGEEILAYGTVGLAPSASGRAQSAYRGGSMGWSLVPPRGERMVLASSSLDQRYAPRISFLGRWAALSIVAWLVVSTVVAVPFLSAVLFGKQEMSRVVDTRTWTTSSKNGTTRHYGIRVETDDGYTFESEVHADVYEAYKRLRELGNARIPTVHAFRWDWASYLGAPAVCLPGGVLAAIVAAVLAGLGSSLYEKRRAWYDHALLSEEGGSGHLSDR